MRARERSVLARLSRRARGDDSGFALLTVLGTVTVLSLMVALATVSASSAVVGARGDQDYQGALAAAEAGVDDYLSHLNLDGNYYLRANRDLVDPANGAMTAVGIPLPGSTTGSTFAYRVLSSADEVKANGALVLETTGRSRGARRTVRATLGKNSFLDYMYYTDFETLDPLNTADPTGNAGCAVYEWAGRPASCNALRLTWKSTDDMKGPVHSNDTMLMNGAPKFESTFDTGFQDPARAYWKAWDGTGIVTPTQPSFSPTSPPRSQPVVMPATNARLRDQAAAGNGCLYTGPTRIVFNAGGTMTVTSPFTTRSSYSCGTFSSASGYSATVAVPDGGVVYVDPGASTCASTNPSWSSSVGFPIAGDTSQNGVSPLLGYACTNGDAFVEGVVKGQVTLGTANNVILTQNITYATQPVSSGTDVLGLAAQNFVQLYRPLTCVAYATWREAGTNRCLGGTDVTVTGRYPWVNPVVQAAVLSTSHSFFLQCYSCGGGTDPAGTPRNMGTLSFTGGMAQRFRGPLNVDCTGGLCGYAKDFNYDSRLRFAPPPYLADLGETRWALQYFVEGTS